MAYTTLLVVEAGVVLFEAHRRRLGPSFEAAFDTFADQASPGIYSLRGADRGLAVTRRDASRLFDGIAVRYLPSPIANRVGPQVKEPSPSAWDQVRAPNVATLLTSPSGDELFEACSAAVLAWDGLSLVAPPHAAPRVDSLSEAFLLSEHRHRRAPVLVSERWPLVLTNAVALACTPATDADEPFPAELKEALRRDLLASARRR